jgi:hypothetical protein
MLADTYYALVEFGRDGLRLGPGATVVPCVPLICANCGNTMLLSPMVSEVLEAAGDEERARA